MRICKFLLNILFFVYSKIIILFFFWSALNNINKGLPWKLAYFDWKISRLKNSEGRQLKLKHLLKKYFLIANDSLSKYQGRCVILENSKNKKELSRQLSNLNKLPALEFMTYIKNLSIYFRLFSSFKEYLFIRQFYRKKLIELQMRSKILNPDALKACLEEDQLELAKKFILTKKITMFNKKKILELDSYICLLKKISSKTLIIKKNNKDYKKYLSIIYKSSIIIEGPSYKKIPFCIKRGQILVKINELKKQYINNVISYYNGGSVGRNSGNIEKVLPTLLFSCFKTRSSFYSLLLKIWRENYNIRIYYNANNILLNDYGAFSIQNIIYDLLMYRPKKIFLTGITFYLGKKLYKKNYIGPNSSTTAVVQGLRIHEPFSNFLFVKNLWKRGIIEVDKNVANILKLSEFKYAMKLDQKYQ